MGIPRRPIGSIACLAVLATAAGLLGACLGNSSKCQDDSDCFQGETCRDGTCVVDSLSSDATGVDSADESDTTQPADTDDPRDSRSAPDTDPSPDTHTTDTSNDTATSDSSGSCEGDPAPGCDCNYEQKSTGVCSNSTVGPNGECSEPDNYSANETNCADDVDNDCDGTVDEPSVAAGDTCESDCECYSGRCATGTCAHRVFVTGDDATHPADLGGLSGADSICQSVAQKAGLDGQWKAILSTKSTSAPDRLTVDAPVYNTNGDRVASASDFFGSGHDAAIAYDAQGTQIAGCSGCPNALVWTGAADPRTQMRYTCEDWSTKDPTLKGRVGDAASSSYPEWALNTTETCENSLHLYCIDGQ